MKETVHHTPNEPEKNQLDAQALSEALPDVQEDDLINEPIIRERVGQFLDNLYAKIYQEEGDERLLWSLRFSLHGEDRIWWAYFRDLGELYRCLSQIGDSFPCLRIQSLKTCPFGLRVDSVSYAPLDSDQKRADADAPKVTRRRDKRLFPLAPFACDYQTSFLKGLGEAAHRVCAQCEIPETESLADLIAQSSYVKRAGAAGKAEGKEQGKAEGHLELL